MFPEAGDANAAESLPNRFPHPFGKVCGGPGAGGSMVVMLDPRIRRQPVRYRHAHSLPLAADMGRPRARQGQLTTHPLVELGLPRACRRVETTRRIVSTTSTND